MCDHWQSDTVNAQPVGAEVAGGGGSIEVKEEAYVALKGLGLALAGRVDLELNFYLLVDKKGDFR
jgi:hypothetical protein